MKKSSLLVVIGLVFSVSCLVYFVPIQAGSQSLLLDPTVNTQDERIRQIIESPVFEEFDGWIHDFLDGNIDNDGEQLKQGESLAAERGELFKELIKIAPKEALKQAISDENYNRLPASLNKYVERRFSANGDFWVRISEQIDRATGRITNSSMERNIVIGPSRYTAIVYGRRLSMTTKLSIPLRGIILGDMAVVDENPLRKIERSEYASLSVDFADLNESVVIAEVGGQLAYFPDQQALDLYVRDIIEWESKIGPVRPENFLNPGELASSWTEGLKTVLFIRVDFPDRPGEPLDANNQPLTLSLAQSVMDTQVSPFFVNSSYNKTSMQTTVTPVVRMPQPQSYYFNNVNVLFTDAENAARGAGYEINNFNLDIIAMSKNQGFSYGAVGRIGGRGAALNGQWNWDGAAHELGHNYGLLHANLWRTTDGTVIGNGSNIEYGNPFDVMGSGGNDDGHSHFNAQYKRSLDWLTDANVQIVTNDGVYRIFAQDSTIPGGIRAIKIRKNVTKNYWIEFRQLFTNNSNAMNGAIINWDNKNDSYGPSLMESQLLDMTPNTSTAATDAPLLIGQNFYDSQNRIRVTVLGKGNTTPESLDVKVELNVGCTFNLVQTSQSFPATGGEATITFNTQSGCSPLATSHDSWLYAVASDTSPVRYLVAANYDSQPRTGTITIAGQIFTVQQAAATTVCAPPPSGLVAWWRGEGNAMDQTGVNNGTLINNMTFGGGKVGGGFLGNYIANTGVSNGGVVQVPDSPSLALTRSMTFEGWLRIDSDGGTVIERRGGLGVDLRQSYSVLIISGRLYFAIYYNSSRQEIDIFSPNPLPLNQFVHFAATLDDATGQMKLYINGSLIAQRTITQRPFDLDPNSNPGVNIGNINGITDELSVYNRALSAPEIQVIYNAGIAGTGATGKCLAAPTVSVSGRILTSDFRGLRNAAVSMTDSNNVVRTATTSSFGFFSFAGVATGAQYVFRVQSRLYRYSPQTVTVNGDLTLSDFVGLE